MIPDFSAKYELTKANGDFVPVSFMRAEQCTWQADPDGIIGTAMVSDLDGYPCLLTMLFRMPVSRAVKMMRNSGLPLDVASPFTVTGFVDFAVGISGERYGRYTAKQTF